MELAKIYVSESCAQVISKKPIPAGLVGGYIDVVYAEDLWADLSKTVVFRSNITRDVVTDGRRVPVPADVLAAGVRLWVGFFGVAGDKALPTFWASLGTVGEAADPSGDESTDPALPVWAQILDKTAELEKKVEREYQPKGDYLESSQLQPAIDTALAQAKESGAFDGPPGKDGADGQPGKDGKDGADGAPGKDGIDGQNGAPGKDGIDGQDGAPGKSAYEYAKDGGYTGTEEEFAAKLAAENPGGSDWNAAEGEPGHVLNRTHWTETVVDIPVFDGNIGSRESIDITGVLSTDEAHIVRMSSRYISIEEMSKSTMAFNWVGTEQEIQLSPSTAVDATLVLGVPGTAVLYEGAMPVVISLPSDSYVMGTTVSAGTWFLYMPSGIYVKSLSCLPVLSYEKVHRLDEKYFPLSVMLKSDRTHWEDAYGVHQLDKKFIPAEWLAEKTLQKVTEYLEPTVFASAPGTFVNISKETDYKDQIYEDVVNEKSVIVVYDGVEHVVKGAFGARRITFGNIDPFQIDISTSLSPDSWYVYTNDETATQHTIAVYLAEVLPVKLPEEYLPKSVESVVLRSSTEGSTKLFKLTVDDTGIITATEVT